MPQARVLVLAGSSVAGSACSQLAAAFMRELALADAQVTYVSLADYPLPLFDPDEPVEPPAAARTLAGLFRANHAAVVAAVEQGGTLSPLLANALAWIGAVPQDRRGAAPLLALAAVSSDYDGQRALAHLRDIVASTGAVIVGSLGIAAAERAFDDKGRLLKASEAAALNRLARDLVFMARRLAAEP